ncbi:unnamed protein product [Ambrosiozyma monospora]|uniref:Unnamed protein product n=1 Tax=Ambrosiozyma monospora TaxID=43982 RepID=A0A9W7DNU5_AMBMO|nr:unnamed protein product [Ambrosiozyma monospora]
MWQYIDNTVASDGQRFFSAVTERRINGIQSKLINDQTNWRTLENRWTDCTQNYINISSNQKIIMVSQTELQQEAKKLDSQYETRSDLFEIPTFKSLGLSDSTQSSNYLCGNSLGLMPKSTPDAINNELKAWSARGVESHFRHPIKGNDWVSVDHKIPSLLAPIVGALENEVACMGTLTMNLNSLLTSFYKPTEKRFKIMFDKGAFPSDYYAMLNQVKLHGFDENALIQIGPKDGETYVKTEDILNSIEENGDSIAIVCFPGIQYYTGQLFNIEKITAKAHSKGCLVGWDLAHAAGNVELKLHDWNIGNQD